MAGKPQDLSTEYLEQALKEWSELEENKSWLCRKTPEGHFVLSENGTSETQDIIVWQDNGKLQCSNPTFGTNFNDWLKPWMKERGTGERKPTRVPLMADLQAVVSQTQPNQGKSEDAGQDKPGSIYDQILYHFGPDLLEVFGETGTLKSKGMIAIALNAAQTGKHVYYLDTERNLSPRDVARLYEAGIKYEYTPILTQIDDKICKDIPGMDVDLVIVDSIGMPVLRRFASMNARERGDALLDIIKWLGVLKEWTFNHNAIAIVINQPQSEFGKTNPKEKGDYRMPFGDKGNYIPGALLLSKKTKDSSQGSAGVFQVYRLRDHAWGEPIFQVEVNNTGASIKMVVQEA